MPKQISVQSNLINDRIASAHLCIVSTLYNWSAHKLLKIPLSMGVWTSI